MGKSNYRHVYVCMYTRVHIYVYIVCFPHLWSVCMYKTKRKHTNTDMNIFLFSPLRNSTWLLYSLLYHLFDLNWIPQTFLPDLNNLDPKCRTLPIYMPTCLPRPQEFRSRGPGSDLPETGSRVDMVSVRGQEGAGLWAQIHKCRCEGISSSCTANRRQEKSVPRC